MPVDPKNCSNVQKCLRLPDFYHERLLQNLGHICRTGFRSAVPTILPLNGLLIANAIHLHVLDGTRWLEKSACWGPHGSFHRKIFYTIHVSFHVSGLGKHVGLFQLVALLQTLLLKCFRTN